MRKIAVIFPGVGYNKDRPLLYYSGKLAANAGYELIHMDFSDIEWSKEQLKDKAFLEQTLKTCLERTKDTLSGKRVGAADRRSDEGSSDIIFISKSIGTVVATAYARENGIDARHICFSPLEMTGDYINEEGGIFFYGDNDPYAYYLDIEKVIQDKKLKSVKIQGGNHSLETGDVLTDVKNLESIIDRVAAVIENRPV